MNEKKRTLGGTIGALSCAKDSALEELELLEGVKVVEAKAFSQCENLAVLRLPRSLTHIDMKAFEGCPIQDIYYAGSAEEWAAVEISPQGSESITAARKHFASGGASCAALRPQGDNKETVFRTLRDLIASGGDGRLHIASPDLCMEGVLTKPGDLTVMVFPRGSTMLIDTGYFTNLPKVVEFLDGIGLKQLDYLVFSHADGDHVGNARAIAERLDTIRNFWWTGQCFGQVVPLLIEYLQERGTCVDLEVRAGRQFTIDGVQVDILGPTEEELTLDSADGETRNSQSMIMKFTWGETAYLTCGDLYAAQEQTVVRRWGGQLRCTISKTNHHGCFTSNTAQWLDAVGGKIIFSCSNDNGSTALAEDLARRGVDYYSTGCNGTLLISADHAGCCMVSTRYDWGLRCIQRVNNRKEETNND